MTKLQKQRKMRELKQKAKLGKIPKKKPMKKVEKSLKKKPTKLGKSVVQENKELETKLSLLKENLELKKELKKVDAKKSLTSKKKKSNLLSEAKQKNLKLKQEIRKFKKRGLTMESEYGVVDTSAEEGNVDKDYISILKMDKGDNFNMDTQVTALKFIMDEQGYSEFTDENIEKAMSGLTSSEFLINLTKQMRDEGYFSVDETITEAPIESEPIHGDVLEAIREVVERLEGDIEASTNLDAIRDEILEAGTAEDVVSVIGNHLRDLGLLDEEVIYYNVAMAFLSENDPSLNDSLTIAEDYGYEGCSGLNSELLASMHSGDEIIYYAEAMKYLSTDDPSLEESFEIAKDYGYEGCDGLTSEVLASMLASDMKQQRWAELEETISSELEDVLDFE